MASVLMPGGVIVLIVPALPALYGPIDRNLGHYRRYSRASLSAVAHEAGLRIRKMHYMNCVGLFGWWTNAHLFRREAQSEFQILRVRPLYRPAVVGNGRMGAAAPWPVAVCGSSETLKISIIIPVYNEFPTFNQVLDRVLRAPLPEQCSKEVIVVDDELEPTAHRRL